MNTQPAMTNRYEVVPLGIDRYTNLTDFDEYEAAENGWPQVLISAALREIGRRELTPNNQLAPTVQPDPAAVRVQLTQAREADADPRANVAGELARLSRELREMTERVTTLDHALSLADAIATQTESERAAARADADALARTLRQIRGWAAMPHADPRERESFVTWADVALAAHAQAKGA